MVRILIRLITCRWAKIITNRPRNRCYGKEMVWACCASALISWCDETRVDLRARNQYSLVRWLVRFVVLCLVLPVIDFVDHFWSSSSTGDLLEHPSQSVINEVASGLRNLIFNLEIRSQCCFNVLVIKS